MIQNKSYNAVVIGGGFFGCNIALELRKYFENVLIIEQENCLLTRASYANQARVHNGYHYPRHFMTAVRSHVNFPKFVSEFKDCIEDSFEKYYAIANQFSKTTPDQFYSLMKRIGSPIEKFQKN